MTLITNFINDDFILLAGDKRLTKKDAQGDIEYFEDNAQKLFLGDNYCIGLQGKVKGFNYDHVESLATFVDEFPTLEPTDIEIGFLKEKLNIPHRTDLTLTISGVWESKLFSFFVDFNPSTITDCLIEDSYRLRFNRENSKEIPSYLLYSQALVYIDHYFRDKREDRNTDLASLSREKLVGVFQYVYKRFEESLRYKYIGVGQLMDYCVIEKSGNLELVKAT